jgi:hypothetical protein
MTTAIWATIVSLYLISRLIGWIDRDLGRALADL